MSAYTEYITEAERLLKAAKATPPQLAPAAQVDQLIATAHVYALLAHAEATRGGKTL